MEGCNEPTSGHSKYLDLRKETSVPNSSFSCVIEIKMFYYERKTKYLFQQAKCTTLITCKDFCICYRNVLFWLHFRVGWFYLSFCPIAQLPLLVLPDPLSSDYSFKGTSSRREHLKTQEGRGEKGGLAASREELLFGVVKVHSLQQTCRILQDFTDATSKKRWKKKVKFL